MVELLKNTRKNKGITISFISKQTKLSRDTIRRIENGKSSIKIEWLPLLESAYKLNRNVIITSYLGEKLKDE